jgi:hypothetical protein
MKVATGTSTAKLTLPSRQGNASVRSVSERPFPVIQMQTAFLCSQPNSLNLSTALSFPSTLLFTAGMLSRLWRLTLLLTCAI